MPLSAEDRAQLRRLEPSDDYLAMAETQGAEVVAVGPFRAMFFARYGSVVPFDSLPPGRELARALDNLRALCDQRGQRPDVEFNDPLWPDLGPALAAAGFPEKDPEPLMLAVPAGFRPWTQAEIVVRFLQPDDSSDDLAAYRRIFRQVMEVDIWTSTDDVRTETARVTAGGLALATRQSTAVGTGFISSFNSIAEITRVATLPEARRQGIAASLTTYMVQRRFAAGDTLVWLTAQNSPAQKLYEKLGFRSVGARRYFGMS